MKARVITGLMAFAALLAVSCEKETGKQEGSLPQTGISIRASVSDLTKAETEGNHTTFVADDDITLYAWTGSASYVSETKVVDGVINIYDGSVWNPTEPMLWKNVTEPHFFLGIHPHRTVSDFMNDEVSSETDLLVATILGDGIKASQTTTAEPIDLVFDHMMAKLNVNVKFRNQWGGVPTDISVTAKAAAVGTINYLTKTIIPGAVTAQELAAAETAAEGYDATYSSVCIPQEGVRTIEFVIDGQKLVYTHAEDLPLEAGNVTTLLLLVGKDKIALLDNTVADWTEGEIENPSEPGSALLAGVTRPLTLKAVENGTTVKFANKSRGTVTWITGDGRTGSIVRNATGSISLDAGQRVWFLGNGSNLNYSDGSEEGSSLISMDKDCEVYGNVMSLLDPNYATLTTLPSISSFSYLFKGQTHLKNNADEGLILPATELTSRCYRGMFQGCTSLTQVVVSATAEIEAGTQDWLSGVPGAEFSLITPVPLQWQMGDELPWGATVCTLGENGVEKIYTTPTIVAETLTYNGTAQKLINPGTAHKAGVALEYSTDNGTSWSTSVPTGTNAGNYNVYCRVQGGGVTSAALAKSIAKAAPTYTAPTKKSNLTYNGGSQALVNAGSATGGTMQYKLGSGSWSATVPSQTNAGSYTVSWKVVGDANHTNVNETSLGSISIAKKAPSFSLSTTSVSFASTDAVDATKTVTITYDGDGTLSQSSNNTAKVTVSRSNKTLTLTRKDGGAGSVTITVSASAGTNYSAPTNQQITVTLTANITGKALKDASVGWKYGSDGKAYPANAVLPAGVTVQGMVAYKNGNSGIVMRSTYLSEELSNWRADMDDSDLFGSTNAYTSSLDNTTSREWRTGTMAEYKNCGLISVSGFNTLNTRLQTAGCNALENNRYLGAKSNKRFYSGDGEWESWNLSGTCLIRPIFVF